MAEGKVQEVLVRSRWLKERQEVDDVLRHVFQAQFTDVGVQFLRPEQGLEKIIKITLENCSREAPINSLL